MKNVNLNIFVTSREALNPEEDMAFIEQAIMKGDVHVFETRSAAQVNEIKAAIGEVDSPSKHFALGQKFEDIAERDGLRCKLRRATHTESGHELWFFGMYTESELDESIAQAMAAKAEAEARGEIH